MSELIVRFGGDEHEAEALLQSLHQWLMDTEDLARARIEAVSRPARPGEMGGWDDVVRLIAENPQLLPVALGAVGSWVSWMFPRSMKEPFSVSINCPNGAVITGTARNAADISKVQERLFRDCLPNEGTG
ncbi:MULTISPECIES: effector-associated constant component EACC1 [Streptomyces]|uniref:effector-associated constant component EACC1 n=1 Tax=Streptomyces sp. SYP-A7185 TaxID=3040076 RepID=UPI0038F6D0AE